MTDLIDCSVKKKNKRLSGQEKWSELINQGDGINVLKLPILSVRIVYVHVELYPFLTLLLK